MKTLLLLAFLILPLEVFAQEMILVGTVLPVRLNGSVSVSEMQTRANHYCQGHAEHPFGKREEDAASSHEWRQSQKTDASRGTSYT